MSPEREGGPPPEAMNWRAPTEDELPKPEDEQPALPDQEHVPATDNGTEGAERPPAGDVAAAEEDKQPLRPLEKIEKAIEKAQAERSAEFGAEFDAEVNKVREGVEGEIRTGVAKLYELLRLAKTPGSDQVPEEKHFNGLVDASGKLAEMLPGMRRELYKELKRDKSFRNAELPEFSQRCMEVIAIWANMEVLNTAGDHLSARREAARKKYLEEGPELPKPEISPPAP